ncbi:hypothetical protein BHE74_00013485 [Ensete ventricosum]|nr:hypothetical protein BHE74_00013485 [Ensete ventricosum]
MIRVVGRNRWETATFATVAAKSLLCHLHPGLHQSGLRRISVLSWTADLARVLALQALEVMKSCDDFDSTMSLESLATIRWRYSIPSEYVLPALGQCPCHPCPGGFNFSIDALEAGLRFPLHSVIRECLSWWRISPSQVAPNS